MSTSPLVLAGSGITPANIADGTDGELITWDASGVPAAVAVGTATHVLTSNGAGAAPTFQAAGGAWNLISTVTVSNATTADFDGSLTSTYDQYLLIGVDMHCDTGEAHFWVRTDANGGASFDAGGSDYGWTLRMSSIAGVQVEDSNAADSEMSLTGDGGSANDTPNTTGAGLLWLRIMNPAGTTYKKQFNWSLMCESGSTALQNNIVGGGTRLSTAAFDSIQILVHTGTFDGVFRLYGIANS
jgi:hypothetical protein